MTKKIIGVTGHRTLSHSFDSIVEKFILHMNNLKGDVVITGMAVGFDQLVAEVCLAADIKYVAAIPFLGQEKRWPQPVQKRYHELLGKAYKTKIVTDGGYEPWKMHARNEWIVNNSEAIIAYFDGKEIKGSGTWACCQYAIKEQVPIFSAWI